MMWKETEAVIVLYSVEQVVGQHAQLTRAAESRVE